MRALAAVLAVLLFGQTTIEDRTKDLAKMAHEIDVKAAREDVVACERAVQHAISIRNREAMKKARADVKEAKQQLLEVEKRELSFYADRARRVAERTILDKPSDEDVEEMNRPGLTQGERHLERMRNVGPLLIVSAELEDNQIGVPEVTIGVGNLSDRTIEAFEVEIECWNAFDEPVKSGGDNIVRGTYQKPIPRGDAAVATWMLSLHDTTTRVSVRITRVKPIEGSVWQLTREEAERSPGAIVSAKMRH
jgi:hypothetical protein